jgi:hypothetical protein
VQESKKKKDQSGIIANIYDQMIKEIMPMPQKPPTRSTEDADTKSIEKSKENEKKKLPITIDSFI